MLADPARTGYVAVALPEEMPVNETIELERRLRDAVGLGLDAIVMNAMWPERFSPADVTKLRAATRDGHSPDELGAVRAALAAHERVKAQRAHVRRLEAATRRADHARCRSSSSPTSSSRTTSTWPPSWHERRPRAASPPSPVGSGGCTQLAVLGRADGRGRGRVVIVDGGGPWFCDPARARRRGDDRDPAAALGALALGHRRRGHRHPARRRWRSTARSCRGCACSTSTPAAGCFEQAFGLSTVVVHTAAGSHTIPLLPAPEADELRTRIAGLARTEDAEDEAPVERADADAGRARAAAPVGARHLLRRRAAQRRVPAARDRRRDAARRRAGHARAAARGDLRRHRPRDRGHRSGAIRYQTTSYYIGAEAIHHLTGALSKKVTDIRLDRIQAIDVHQGPLQRAFGVFSVDIQTGAGKKGGEISLPALDARRRSRSCGRRGRRRRPRAADDAPAGPTQRVARRELLDRRASRPASSASSCRCWRAPGRSSQQLFDERARRGGGALRSRTSAPAIVLGAGGLLVLAWLLSTRRARSSPSAASP